MTNEDMSRELNLPDFNKPFDDWTDGERAGANALLQLLFKYRDHLDLDPDDEALTLNQIMSAAAQAFKQDRMPDEFYDEILEAAIQRRGGRIQ